MDSPTRSNKGQSHPVALLPELADRGPGTDWATWPRSKARRAVPTQPTGEGCTLVQAVVAGEEVHGLIACLYLPDKMAYWRVWIWPSDTLQLGLLSHVVVWRPPQARECRPHSHSPFKTGGVPSGRPRDGAPAAGLDPAFILGPIFVLLPKPVTLIAAVATPESIALPDGDILLGREPPEQPSTFGRLRWCGSGTAHRASRG